MWHLELIDGEQPIRIYRAETWQEINTIFLQLMEIDRHAVEKVQYLIYEKKSAPQMSGNRSEADDWVGDVPCCDYTR